MRLSAIMSRSAIWITLALVTILAAWMIYRIALSAQPISLSAAQKEFKASEAKFPKLLRYYDPKGELYVIDWMDERATVSLDVDQKTGLIRKATAFIDGGPTAITELSEPLGDNPETIFATLMNEEWGHCLPGGGIEIPRIDEGGNLPDPGMYKELGYEAERERNGTLIYHDGKQREEYSFDDGMLTEIAFYPPHSPLAKVDISYPEALPGAFTGKICPPGEPPSQKG